MADDNLPLTNEPRSTGRPVYESTLLPKRKRRRFSPWLVVPGLLILLLAVFYFLVFGPKPRRAVATAGSIIYASDLNSPGMTHLWTMKAADPTAVPRQLTTGAASDTSPAFTADGSQAAFLSNRGGGQNQIWLMDSDGKNAVQVTRTAGAKSHPLFAPGSNVLLGFLSGASLAVMDVGKGDASILLPPPVTSTHPTSTDPSQSQGTTSAAVDFMWKPFADQASADKTNPGLAAVLETAGVQTLAVMPSLSAAPRLTQNDQPNGPPLATADRIAPAWAPDGSKMAVGLLHVLGLPAGQKASGLIQFDGTGSVQKPLLPLLRDPAIGPQNPLYSPDGTQIVFELWRQADLASRTVLGLFIVDADGTGTPHLLARGDSSAAQFSLDGKQVYFLHRRADGGHDLSRVNADGTGPIRLSDGHSDITSFALSPQVSMP
ncbi:MAG: TolB family protein [Janthinobacterium lividum]